MTRKAYVHSRFRPRVLLAQVLLPSLLCATACRSLGKADPVGARPAAKPAPLAAAPSPVQGSGQVSESEALSLAGQLCDVLHGLPARRKAECCGTPPQRILVDECVKIVSRSLVSHALEFAPGALQTCVAEMDQALRGCDWVTPGEPLSPPACQRLFRGQVPAGSACRSSLECAGTLHCQGTTPSKPGVCTPPGKLGAGCGSHVDALGAATLTRDLERTRPFCAEFCSLVSHKCEASPPEGARCAASVNCADGQSCVQGACSAKPRQKRGQRCETARCDEGLRCVVGECRELSAPGAACSSDFECAAGGCVARSDGARVCGAQCSLSLAQLKNAGSPGMRLPLRPEIARTP